MPLRKTLDAVRENTPDPRIFVWGNGCWSFFSEPVYPTLAAAKRAWSTSRPQGWAATSRGEVPGAAEAHDGLTACGFRALWDSWQHVTFPIEKVRAAIQADRDAVARFRARDPRGAASCAVFLDAFLARLSEFDEIATARAALTGPARYGSASTALHDRLHAGRYGVIAGGAR